MAKKDNDDIEQPKPEAAERLSSFERLAALELKVEAQQAQIQAQQAQIQAQQAQIQAQQAEIIAIKEQAKKFRF